MKEYISAVLAILLIIEFFFLGGSVFAYKESTKNILRTIAMVFGIVAIAIGW